MTLAETRAHTGTGSSGGWLALRAAIAITLLWLVLRGAGAEALGARFSRATLPAVLAGSVLLLLSQALAAVRWRLLLGPGAPRLSALIHLYLVGAFFSLFLPTAVGGDAFRATMVARSAPEPEAAVLSVVLDRVFGVVALLLFGVAGVLLDPASASGLGVRLAGALAPGRLLLLVSAGLTGLAILALLARRQPRLRALPATLAAALRATLARGRSAALALLVSLAVQALMVLLWMVIARGVGLSLPASRFLVGVPLVSLATMLPLSLAGLGVREWAWVWFLAPFGVPSGDAVALSLSYFACPLLAGLVGGALFTARGAGPGLPPPAARAGDRPAAADPESTRG